MGSKKIMFFEIECVNVVREFGRNQWEYHVLAEGDKVTVNSDRSLTLDELKDRLELKDNGGK